MQKYKWWHTTLTDVEKKALNNAFDERSLTYGRYCQEFEEEFAEKIGSKYAVVTNSGTSALCMALISLGIGKNDEVILPPLGWIATTQAVLMAGATPIFVDVLTEKPILDISLIKNAITSRTKAVIPVHYNGRIVDSNQLVTMLNDYGIYIIEDCCKAMFSKNTEINCNKFVGTYGNVGCFSFGMISLISCVYGGACVTNDYETYEKLKIIRNHGVVQNDDQVDNETYMFKSLNFKPSDLLFSIGLPQLKRIDEKINNLIELNRLYQSAIKNSQNLQPNYKAGEIPIFNDYSIDSPEILKEINNAGIETYPYHSSQEKAKYLSKQKITCVNAEKFCKYTYHLPSGIFRTDLDDRYFNLVSSVI